MSGVKKGSEYVQPWRTAEPAVECNILSDREPDSFSCKMAGPPVSQTKHKYSNLSLTPDITAWRTQVS